MRFLFFLSSLFLCFISTAQQTQYQSLLLDESLTKNANAIVRFDEMKINLMATNKMSYTVKRVITVLNKEGDRYATNRVSFDKEKSIKSLNVFIYDKFGEEVDHIKKKDFNDMSAADGFSLYTDDRMLYHRYTPTNYPYTISINYEVETSDTGFFPPWYFVSSYKVSVEKSYYEIKYANAQLKPEIKEFNLEGISVSKKDEAGIIVYQSSNITAFKSESLSPALRNVVPRLKVRLKKFNLKGEEAEVSDWKEMGVWMNNSLLKDRAELNPATVSIAKKG